MDYELGLCTLKARLPAGALDEFNVHEAKLLDNLRRERLYGSTETIRAERAAIVHGFNQLAQTHLGMSFNDLCQPATSPVARPINASVLAVQGGKVDLAALRRVLVDRLDLEELRTLCFDLGVDYDNLGGEGKGGKVRELLAYFQRRDQLSQLVRYIRHHRPDIELA